MMSNVSEIHEENEGERNTMSEDFMSCTTSSAKNVASVDTQEVIQPTESALFGDKDCGEPTVTQHLIFDFACDAKIDSDESKKKCYEFWEFLQNEPDFQNQMVVPETSERRHASDSSIHISSFGPKPNVKMSEQEVEKEIVSQSPKTALSVLSFVEGQGFLDRLFETKLPITYCPVSLPDYRDHKLDDAIEASPMKYCECLGLCRCYNKRKSVGAYRLIERDPRARVLNDEMNQWDKEHPKSFKPPGKAPPLCRCVKRKMAT